MVCGSKACVNYVKSYADLKFSDKTFAGYCILLWLIYKIYTYLISLLYTRLSVKKEMRKERNEERKK